MKRLMRGLIAVVLLAGVGCAGRTSSPRPVATTTAQAPLADTLHNPQLRAALARAVAASSAVDTILVVPAEIHLRVGERLGHDKLQITARSAAGETVADFAPVYILASPVASFDGLQFEGRAAGEAVLYVEGFPSAPPRVSPRPRPSTRVRVVVQP